MSNINQILKEAVELIKNGEREKASRVIYDSKVKKETIGYLIKRGRDRDDALQIFHDGLLVFLDKVENGKLLNHDNLSGFLFGICKNISLLSNRLIESIEAEKKKFEKDYPDIILSGSDNEFGLQNYAKKFIKAYLSLGNLCQTIIKLKYILDLSHKTIAKKMQYKDADVSKTRLHYCLNNLFKSMDTMSSKFSYEDLEDLRKYLEKDED